MSEAWQSAQDRLRRHIWDARGTVGEEGPKAAMPSTTPLQPPELVYPAIVSPRPLIGRPTRVIKRVLHRLLQPLVFGPQSEFNFRVAANLNDNGRWSEAVGGQLQDLEAISEANRQRLDAVAQELEALHGDVLAARAELQSQLVVVEKLRQADGEDKAPTEARHVDTV